MKKMSVLLLASVMAFSLIACSNKEDSDSKGDVQSTEKNEQSIEEEKKEEVKEEVKQNVDWPENEFTALIPEPTFSYIASNVNGNVFTANFSGVTIEKIRDYTEQVKNAGFNINAEAQDSELYGMVSYTYSASNADGYSIKLYFSSESLSLTMKK